MKTPCMLIISLLYATLAFSQPGYESGYIITQNGDTLFGKIKDKKYTDSPANADKISFIDVHGDETSKEPDEIKQYVKKQQQFFVVLPIGIESKLKFAEVLESGEVILYRYISNSLVNLTSNIVSSSDPKKKEKDNSEYFLQKRKDPNSLMKVKAKAFKQITLLFFNSNSSLAKQIESNSLKIEDIRYIVKTYNEGAASTNK